MVASVGPSYNVLSLFQKQDGAAAADTTAVDAIIDQIQQMKTDASAARLQGASAATQAWIESSEAGTASATATADPASASAETTASGRQFQYVWGIDTLMGSVETYNNALKSAPASQEKIKEITEELKNTTDLDRIKSLETRLNIYNVALNRASEILSVYPAQMESTLAKINVGYDVSGQIYKKNEDGSYSYGVFQVKTKDGGLLYWQRDESGEAFRVTFDGTKDYRILK